MATVKLDPASLAEMRAFYQGELQTTLSKLQHIQSVLQQLGDTGLSIQINATGFKEVAKATSSVTKIKSSKRRRKGKPGPKSKWDKMIISILKREDKPFTYDQMTAALMAEAGRPSTERARTKATVQNTIFKLRGTKKLTTFSKGSREKFIALAEWTDADGTVASKYTSLIPASKKAAPKKKTGGKRGRPKGSKNAKTAKATGPKSGLGIPKEKATPKKKSGRGRGRPKKVAAPAAEMTPMTVVPKAALKKASKKAAPKVKKAAAPKAKKAAPVKAKKAAAPKVKKAAAPKAKKALPAKAKKVATVKAKKAAAPKAKKAAAPKAKKAAPAKAKKATAPKVKKAVAPKAVKAAAPIKVAAPEKASTPEKTSAPEKATAPKKASAPKKAKARKTPARGLSQAKAVQLPGEKKED